MAKSAKKKSVDVDRVHRLLFVTVFVLLVISLGVLAVRDYNLKSSGPTQLITDDFEQGE